MESEHQEYETVAEALAEVQRTFGGVPLTLSEGLRVSDGKAYGTGPVWSYDVVGLPSGEHVSIQNVRASSEDGGRWEIRRFTAGVR